MPQNEKHYNLIRRRDPASEEIRCRAAIAALKSYLYWDPTLELCWYIPHHQPWLKHGSHYNSTLNKQKTIETKNLN